MGGRRGEIYRDHGRGLPWKLAFSYIFDWIVIIAFGLVSYAFSTVAPHYRAFSLLDLNISYPLLNDTVSTIVLGVVAGLIPVIVIFIVSILFVRGSSTPKPESRLVLWQRKVWECHVGWIGLALSLVTELMIVSGVKVLTGKPRPDLLARCQPDLKNISKYMVGGYGQSFSNEWVLVGVGICQQTDSEVLRDGFTSFPSGHSATSFGGLLYLTLFLCAKFGIAFPMPWTRDNNVQNGIASMHSRGAAPPIWLLLIAYLPVAGAIYICGSRYFDYHHDGFDVLAGAFVGICTAYMSFRLYQVPLTSSYGRAWGPRSSKRAFGVSVGNHGFADETGEQDNRSNNVGGDVELGYVSANPARRPPMDNNGLQYSTHDNAVGTRAV